MAFVVSWAALATAVLALALYRYFVARNEDDYIHVGVDNAPQQRSLAKKLDAIDRWGKVLTIVATVYGLVIAGLFMYSAWVESSTKIQ
jgi:hypothetical protein